MKKFGVIFDRINTVIMIVSSIVLGIIMLFIAFEVIERHFLNNTTYWLIPIGQLINYFIVFAGSAWLLKQDGHVRMDLILNRLNPKNKRRLNIITSSAAAIMCLTMVWGGAILVIETWGIDWEKSELLDIQASPLYAIIPISFLLLFIQFLRNINELRRGQLIPPEKDKIVISDIEI
ncbi:TRAP transporter small permease [Chloroflexota bacterium]